MGRLVIVVMIIAAIRVAHADEAVSDEDLKLLRADATVLHDGRSHYLAYATVPFAKDVVRVPAFYGDGKTFFRYGTVLYNSVTKRVESSDGPVGAKFGFRRDAEANAAWCNDRRINLTALEPRAAAEVVAGATFKVAPTWDRRPLRLARDDSGTYYYVDLRYSAKLNASADRRLYIGKRGLVRQVKLKDTVNDNAGELFMSERGTFKFSTNYYDIESNTGNKTCVRPHEAWWIVGDKVKPLTIVGIADEKLIYEELGAYVGERFGTPCDIF